MYMVYLHTSGKTLINKRKSFQSAGLACWLHSRLVRDPVLKKVWLDQNYSSVVEYWPQLHQPQIQNKLDVVIHAFNPSTGESEGHD